MADPNLGLEYYMVQHDRLLEENSNLKAEITRLNGLTSESLEKELCQGRARGKEARETIRYLVRILVEYRLVWPVFDLIVEDIYEVLSIERALADEDREDWEADD